MMNISDFRKQHPEYSDMSDHALANALHKKYYSDLNKSDFYQKFGVSQPEKSTWGGRFATGMRDPVVGGAQLINNSMEGTKAGDIRKSIDSWLYENTDGMMGYKGGDINQAIQKREAEYQAALPDDEGFDEARIGGKLLTSVLGTKGLGAPKTILGSIGQGAAVGGGMSAIDPVASNDFWEQKQKNTTVGGLSGAVFGPLGYAFGRMFAPKFTNKPKVDDLNNAGVQPTLGQTLGGKIDATEQKLISLPFIGDSIAAARERAKNQFNTAMINKSIASTGEKVTGTGAEAIDQANKAVSGAYRKAHEKTAGFILDDISNSKISNLMKMADGMTESSERKFNKFMSDKMVKNFSPIGGIESKTYKNLDSYLYKEIQKVKNDHNLIDYRDALKEIKNVLKEQAKRASPEYADLIGKADKAYKNMKAIKAASKSTTKNETFTPSQALMGMRQIDRSVDKDRFVTNKMDNQLFARNAQDVLGDSIPNSVTVDRLLATGGLGYGLAVDPLSTIGIFGLGSLLYTPVMQKAMINAATKRPEFTKQIAPVISKAAPFLAAPLVTGN